jgi:uncharacterized protein involved in exopolysaccharide biosynthesis
VTVSRQTWLVVLAAIVGLALAVGLAVLTSSLTTQHVGLAGEPSRPASGLVVTTPRATPTDTATTTTTVTTPAAVPSDDGQQGDD